VLGGFLKLTDSGDDVEVEMGSKPVLPINDMVENAKRGEESSEELKLLLM